MNKREIIAQAIEAGGQTKESLMEVATVNAAGLASQFTYLRLTGKFPVKGDDGIFKFIPIEEWEAMKAAAGSRVAGPVKSPAEQMVALEKRKAKQQGTLDKRTEAYGADKSKLNKLKLQRANVELDITLYEIEVLAPKLEAVEEVAEEATEEAVNE